MAQKERKVDPKAVVKDLVLAELEAYFATKGVEFVTGSDIEGCTKHTLVLKDVDGFDVKVVLTTPKAGKSTYLD